MEKKNIKQILNNVVEKNKIPKNILLNIEKTAENFCKELKEKLKRKRIKAEVFIGGSLAKKTLIKKPEYDVDIFVRFEKKQDMKLGKIINGKKIHGSRDYFQIKKNDFIIEVVPVLKIKKPENAENVTDLSYFHVKYVVDKIKKYNLEKEIILAKAFCYAQNCYGAESYIKGFSGYSLELLICHYKSFLKFIKEITKTEQIVINNSKKDLRELNESKLQSPIILIDPTYKQRNALAGLSKETFLKFQKACKSFLKNPSEKYFEKKDLYEKYKNNKKIKIIRIKTNKQEGDISGTKSKKFFNFFIYELKKEFNIKKKDFEYKEKENISYFYLIIEKKKSEIRRGPPVKNIYHLIQFKKAHKNAFIKNKYSYVKINHNLSFNEWFSLFKKQNRKIIKEMDIKELKVIH